MSFKSTYFCIYSSSLGDLFIQGYSQDQHKYLTHLIFISSNDIVEKQKRMKDKQIEENSSFFQEAITQLKEYFSGNRQKFTVNLAPEGTQFQQQVWQALKDIPYGTTQSYQDIAHKINNPKAVRAVGRANGLNPIPIIIPCHRVIGTSGKLTGYAYGLALKAQLLTLENPKFIVE